MSVNKGIITCPQTIAGEAGARIFEEGGNAFDAALAVAFMQWIVDPFMKIFRGKTLMGIRGKDHIYLDKQIIESIYLVHSPGDLRWNKYIV